MVAEKDEEVCVVTNEHSAVGISRLHGFHHYLEISRLRHDMYLTVTLLQLFTQQENETLLILLVGQKLFFLNKFFMVTGVSAENVTVVPAFPFDHHSLGCHVLRVCTIIAIEHNDGVSAIMHPYEDPRDHGMR